MSKRFEEAVRSDHDAPDSYGRRHNAAVRAATMNCAGNAEAPLVNMLRGWYNYATAHEERFDSKIGTDYALGSAWFQIGSALLRMLDGGLGRLDGGTLDRFIRQTMLGNGFEQRMIDDA